MDGPICRGESLRFLGVMVLLLTVGGIRLIRRRREVGVVGNFLLELGFFFVGRIGDMDSHFFPKILRDFFQG